MTCGAPPVQPAEASASSRLTRIISPGAPAGGARPAARGGALEVHHVVKRAQGGSDFDLDGLVVLCPTCHAQTDALYARGRLVISPLGEGHFTFEVTRGADKWTIRA